MRYILITLTRKIPNSDLPSLWLIYVNKEDRSSNQYADKIIELHFVILKLQFSQKEENYQQKWKIIIYKKVLNIMTNNLFKSFIFKDDYIGNLYLFTSQIKCIELVSQVLFIFFL